MPVVLLGDVAHEIQAQTDAAHLALGPYAEIAIEDPIMQHRLDALAAILYRKSGEGGARLIAL